MISVAGLHLDTAPSATLKMPRAGQVWLTSTGAGTEENNSFLELQGACCKVGIQCHHAEKEL